MSDVVLTVDWIDNGVLQKLSFLSSAINQVHANELSGFQIQLHALLSVKLAALSPLGHLFNFSFDWASAVVLAILFIPFSNHPSFIHLFLTERLFLQRFRLGSHLGFGLATSTFRHLRALKVGFIVGFFQEHLEEQGVIFLSIEDGLREHPDLFREYFGTVVAIEDNKFAALNSSVWSGGSFIYIPPGVRVELPLQAYFRLNVANIGQFERTLIIADEGAQVHYVEGCTAPTYTTDSFHSGVIEIVVKKNARVRYTTIQNWSNNVYNLVTQRALVHENATMEWVDANLGSKLTMKYPSCYLLEQGARGEILSMAFAGTGQHQDAGGKVIHFAPNTSSKITSKFISQGSGRSSYRGLLKVYDGAHDVKSNVVCDALLLDENSRSDTYPYIEIDEDDVTIGHEASVSKVGEEQLFYLMSRGLSEEEATTMVVSGFIEPLVKELPMEYAIEMNRLIQLQMEGSIG